MASTLIVTSVEKLQSEIVSALKQVKNKTGIYISLNKSQKSTEAFLKKNGINTKKLFFIDCVTEEKTRDDVLHIPPDKPKLLKAAVHTFLQDVQQDTFLIVDALSTLLIYNSENTVAQLVKDITTCACEHDVTTIAFSPKTKGEELLNKIFNFFDEVKKK